VRTFNLDEYIGLPPGDVTIPTGITCTAISSSGSNVDPRNTHLPDGIGD
jgi:hypothetical protein